MDHKTPSQFKAVGHRLTARDGAEEPARTSAEGSKRAAKDERSTPSPKRSAEGERSAEGKRSAESERSAEGKRSAESERTAQPREAPRRTPEASAVAGVEAGERWQSSDSLGRRTPGAAGRHLTPELPSSAPRWMRRARRMAEALEAAIREGDVNASTEASIERAWAAWELSGTRDVEIAKVAHVVQHAHRAIRSTERAELAQAVNDCAEVLKGALPPHVGDETPFEDIVDLVRALRAEADPWMAVLTVTSALLGWAEAGRAHAARAIRVALDAHPRRSPE